MAKIELKNATYTYKEQARPYTALRALSLAVGDGQFLGLLGPSGGGKSTLLRLLAGLAIPDAGAVLVSGKPVDGPGPDRGVVFQDYSLFPWMTARRNVAFCARQADRSLSKKQADARAFGLLESVGLADSAERYPKELSGGMRQRVALARVLAADPPVLLFDEPFGAVDPGARAGLQALLERVWSAGTPRKTVVFVTHDVEEALLLCDRIVYMDTGGIIDDFPVPFARPRERAVLLSPGACALRKRCLRLFNESGAQNEE